MARRDRPSRRLARTRCSWLGKQVTVAGSSETRQVKDRGLCSWAYFFPKQAHPGAIVNGHRAAFAGQFAFTSLGAPTWALSGTEAYGLGLPGHGVGDFVDLRLEGALRQLLLVLRQLLLSYPLVPLLLPTLVILKATLHLHGPRGNGGPKGRILHLHLLLLCTSLRPSLLPALQDVIQALMNRLDFPGQLPRMLADLKPRCGFLHLFLHQTLSLRFFRLLVPLKDFFQPLLEGLDFLCKLPGLLADLEPGGGHLTFCLGLLPLVPILGRRIRLLPCFLCFLGFLCRRLLLLPLAGCRLSRGRARLLRLR
mmetsp:Transcript_78844/g.189226  ORF Transcript_78844/g.189226 Transcript_78844/m.189226 type:complete len:309 (+) Transcript_78844:474-1400(+)